MFKLKALRVVQWFNIYPWIFHQIPSATDQFTRTKRCFVYFI